MKTLTIAVASFLALLALPATANDRYVGMSVGNALYDVDFPGVEHGNDHEHSITVGAIVGKRLANWIAIEGEFTELGSYSILNSDHGIDASVSAISGAAIASIGPFFLKAGAEYWSMAATINGHPGNNSGFGPLYGAGLSFDYGQATIRLGYDVHVSVDDGEINGKEGITRTYVAVLLRF